MSNTPGTKHEVCMSLKLCHNSTIAKILKQALTSKTIPYEYLSFFLQIINLSQPISPNILHFLIYSFIWNLNLEVHFQSTCSLM